MSADFSERCIEAVKSVKHHPDCGFIIGHGMDACDCSRDVRIGRGMAAAILAYYRAAGPEWDTPATEDAALATFAEAAR